MKDDKKNSAIKIRKAKASDKKEIKSFLRNFPSESVLQKHFPPIETSFVATTSDGSIVGHAGLDISATKMAEIRSLAVDRNFQGMGIAGKIVKEAEKLAKKKGVWVLFADTVAVKFFEKKGYKHPKKGSAVLFKYF